MIFLHILYAMLGFVVICCANRDGLVFVLAEIYPAFDCGVYGGLIAHLSLLPPTMTLDTPTIGVSKIPVTSSDDFIRMAVRTGDRCSVGLQLPNRYRFLGVRHGA